MKIPRVSADSLPPPPVLRPAAGTPAPSAPSAQAAPSGPDGLRPLDAAGALRVFVEQVRLSVVEQLGRLQTEPPAPLPGEGPAEAASRVVRFLQGAAAELGARGRGPVEANLARALQVGAERTLAAAGARAGAMPGLAVVIDEAHAQASRALSSLPREGPVRPSAAARALVTQVRAAIEERLGILPAAASATGEADSPAEALEALGRLFRAAARDPVVAVRASPLALRQAVELGAARAATAVATSGPATTEAGIELADLRSLALRLVPSGGSAGVAPAPTDVGSALRSLATEVRVVLLEAGVAPVAPAEEAEPEVQAPRMMLGIVRTLAQAAQSLTTGDPRASRAAAETALDVALRRTMLQMSPTLSAHRDAAAVMAEVRAEAVRMLIEMEAAAQRLPAGHWSRPAADTATALLRGQDPPFRFDLVMGRAPAPRRRRGAGQGREAVEPIETTDPDQEGTEAPDDEFARR